MWEQILIIFALALIMELIDGSMGMGYGTVLSPLLILLGFSAIQVVPAILISQAAGGAMAALSHHKLKNADFSRKSYDLKVVLIITFLGILASIIGALVAIKISKEVLTYYIGVLVLAIGIIMLLGIVLKFSMKKMFFVGLLAAFNKGMSGGGYGPVVTGSQVVLGNKEKNSVGITTLAEVPICLAGFAIYMFKGDVNSVLLLPLICGSLVAGLFAGHITHRFDSKVLRKTLAVMITLLGVAVLVFGVKA